MGNASEGREVFVASKSAWIQAVGCLALREGRAGLSRLASSTCAGYGKIGGMLWNGTWGLQLLIKIVVNWVQHRRHINAAETYISAPFRFSVETGRVIFCGQC